MVCVASPIISPHPIIHNGSADTLDFDLTAFSSVSLSACSKLANKSQFPELVL